MHKTSKDQAIELTRELKKIEASFGEGSKYNCPHRYKTMPRTICIDWLQIGLSFKDAIMEEMGASFSKGVYRWLYTGHGTKHHRHLYEVYCGQHKHFTVEITPNRDGRKNTGVLKIENYLLYQDWYDVLTHFIDSSVLEVLRISRVDIAHDGLNHIYDLMCDWSKGVQQFDCERGLGIPVKLIGKSKVSAHDINRTTRKPKGFTVGNPKGCKQIAIYNKSQDIIRNSKSYISSYWEANGLDSSKEQYRFEVRLKRAYLETIVISGHNRRSESGQLEAIEKYTPVEFLALLNDRHFLQSITYKACQGFFEWIYCDDSNVTRCTRLLILPPPAHELVKTNKQYNGTAYKAKMQVHNTYYQVCSGIVGLEEGVAIINTQLNCYELHEWYANRMYDFAKRYKPDDISIIQSLQQCSVPTRRNSNAVAGDALKTIFWSKNSKQLTLINKRNEPISRNTSKGRIAGRMLHSCATISCIRFDRLRLCYTQYKPKRLRSVHDPAV